MSNTSRLRKTFQYPGDDIDKSPAEGIDEEEQSRLIAQLAARDARTNSFYAPLLPFLPGLSLLLFLVSAFFGSNQDLSSTNPVLYATCLASLLLSLALSFDIEQPTGSGTFVSPLQAITNQQGSPLAHPAVGTARANLMAIAGAAAGVVALLALFGMYVTPSRSVGSSAVLGMYAFPVIFVYLIVVSARRELRPLDVKGLEQLKYKYRGA